MKKITQCRNKLWKAIGVLFFVITLTVNGWGQELPINWTGDTGIDIYQETTDPHGGVNCAKISVNTGAQANCDFNNSTSISVTAGETFTVNFWYKTSPGVKGRIVYLWTGASTVSGGYADAGATSWTQFTEIGTVPTGATALTITIRFYDQSGFSAPEIQYIDDLTFDSPTGNSLTVTNGDLESWPLPELLSTIPADGALSIDVNAKPSATFDKNLAFGTGNISIYNSGGTLFEAFDVASSSNVSISGATVTINPSSDFAFSSGYYIQIDATAIEDLSGNAFVGISDATTWNFTTRDPDITAPTWTSSYPQSSNVANSSFDLLVNIDEPGTAYYVVVASGSTAPSSAEVKSGVDYSTVTVVAWGSVSIASATTEYSASISTGLSPGVDYDVYLVAEDDEASPNLMASPVSLSVSTTDIKPEPSSHASSFTAIATNDTTISLAWLDAVGAQLPENYLIIYNTDNSFTNPVDGTAQANGAGVINVAYGVQTYELKSVNPGTSYYFQIYPYTNSGATINYKTDATIPSASATTPKLELISPNGGETYYSGEPVTITWSSALVTNVKIDVSEDNGVNWNTIIATTDATDGTEDYTIPGDASFSSKYLIRISDLGNPGIKDSSDASFTTIPDITIKDIQSNNTAGASNYEDDTVRFSGIVSAVASKNFYLQDGPGDWKGIYVYYNTTHTYAVGDSLTIVAGITEYNGLTEVVNVNSISLVNSLNEINPLLVNATNANAEAYEGGFVKIVNATCTSGSSGTYVLNDGSGDITLYKSIYSELSLTIGSNYTVSGVMTWYNGGSIYELLPRSAADIQSAVDTVSSTVYTVNSTSNTITAVPFVAGLTEFKGNLSAAIGATFQVYESDGTTVADTILSTYKVKVTAEDGLTTRTYTITKVAGSSAKDILSFSLNGLTGSITGQDIIVEVPYTTDVTNLVATFTLSDFASAKIGVVLQESGVTANDFTSPITYTIIAQDGTTLDWKVTVNKAIAPSNATDILTFSINGVDGTVNSTNHSVSITFPYGTNVTALVASFNLSDGAKAKIGVTLQESGVTANDFTNPITYSVIAENNTTSQDWIVTVTVIAASTDATLSSITVDGKAIADFSSNVYKYDIQLPFGTTKIPVVLSTATSATAMVEQVSATTLPGSTLIKVTAQDKVTSLNYTVNFTLAPDTLATLSSIKVDGKALADFKADKFTYDIKLPYGTRAAPEVLSTATSAKATIEQVSATTLPGSTLIKVTAEDKVTILNYTVNFTVDEVGINENMNLMSKVYPNPTKGFITVEMGTYTNQTTIYVTDVVGKVIETHKVNQLETQLNLTNYKAGIYYIVVNDNAYRNSLKVIVE